MNEYKSGDKNHVVRYPWLLLLILPAIIISSAALNISKAPAQENTSRVVVLGFDGADYNLFSRYLNEGQLPNFARLQERGIFEPLMSTTPPESPVAWSSFITGTNPGKTGIFDFLRRNPDTYFPELNMTDVDPPEFAFDLIPVKAPVMTNARKGRAFWEYTAAAGVETVGVMMPMNMPPDEAEGVRILSGLGVPDMRKTMGTYVYYVEDIEVARENTGSEEGTEMGGRVIQVTRQGNEIETFLPGPFDIVDPDPSAELRLQAGMTVDPLARTVQFRLLGELPFKLGLFFGGIVLAIVLGIILGIVAGRRTSKGGIGFITGLIVIVLIGVIAFFISLPGTKERVVNVAEGEWSEWIPAEYLITDIIPAVGFFKIFLVEAEPDFQVYVTPVNIDPRRTNAALSFPKSFAPDLLDRFGYFKTYGWDSETWGLNENVISEDVFFDDLLENWDTKADMVLELMKDGDWELYSAVFQGTDHTSHMYWRFVDPEHPMYDEEMAEEYGDAILTVYQRADTLVGRVMDEVLDDNDELIVMSDHGFQTWRYSVNLNRWLVDNGYLAEKQSVLSDLLAGSEDESSVYELFQPGSEFFQWVDWSRSRAYALGLGQIYLNLEGREAEGIVTGNERDELIDEIIAGLREMRNPINGERMIINAYRADELYHGDQLEYSPDIVIGFAPGYRVSWQTCLGTAANDLVETNLRKWSGDHCSLDPSGVRGILFSTVPITVDNPNLIDLAPSILSLFGIEKPEVCDGRVIFQAASMYN